MINILMILVIITLFDNIDEMMIIKTTTIQFKMITFMVLK